MRLVNRYILTEFLWSFFVSLILFLSLFFLGNLFILADSVIRKGLNITSAFKSLVWGILSSLNYSIPTSCLLACFLSIGRMSQDNEILALKTSGMSFLKIIWPLLVVGILISFFSIYLYLNFIPSMHFEQRKALKNLLKENPAFLFEPASFIENFKGFLIFVYEVKDNKLFNVFIYEKNNKRTIFAKKAEFLYLEKENKVKLKLSDGIYDEINPQNPDRFIKVRFDNMFLNLDLKKEKNLSKKLKDMKFSELRMLLKYKKDIFGVKLEMIKRISMGLFPFFFILFGAGLSQKLHIRAKTLNLLLGLLVSSFFYAGFLFLVGICSEKKITPLILFMPHILTSIVSLYLIRK